jgi:hypothetical protein
MQLLTRIVLAALAISSCGRVLSAADALQPEVGGVQATDKADVFKYRDRTLAFEITAAGHATVSYRSATSQRAINVVVFRGEQNDLQADPEAPPYALDIRVADNENVVLVAQSGTGHLVNQAWGQELAGVPLVVDDKNREQDNAELAYFANALQEKVKPRLSKSKLSRWAWVVDETASLLNYAETQSALTSVLEEDTSKTTTTYSNVVTIRKKPAINQKYFDHSSLSSTLKKSNGTTLYTIVTCNHGACADSSTMNLHCSKTFTQSTVDAWASDLLCDFFGWLPYGVVHVCNNDTRAEYLSIKNQARGSWNSCWLIRPYAPPCD